MSALVAMGTKDIGRGIRVAGFSMVSLEMCDIIVYIRQNVAILYV